MFNIKGTLYYIYDGDNEEYYCLHRYDRMNPVRIPRGVADKYLIRKYKMNNKIIELEKIDDNGIYSFHFVFAPYRHFHMYYLSIPEMVVPILEGDSIDNRSTTSRP